jgi:DNA-binding NtrC family response regulator
LEKNLGLHIPKLETDLTDKLLHPSLDIYVSPGLNFREAKKCFRKEFLKRELRFHRGNISQLSRSLGIDRRSVHRTIKDLEIDLLGFRHGVEDSDKDNDKHEDKHHQEQVHHYLRSVLDNYKEIIHPQKIEQLYQDLPSLSSSISKFLPRNRLTWKEAEKEFEKLFLGDILKEFSGNIAKAANRLEIRVETLHRKAKKLGLSRQKNL